MRSVASMVPCVGLASLGAPLRVTRRRGPIWVWTISSSRRSFQEAERSTACPLALRVSIWPGPRAMMVAGSPGLSRPAGW